MLRDCSLMPSCGPSGADGLGDAWPAPHRDIPWVHSVLLAVLLCPLHLQTPRPGIPPLQVMRCTGGAGVQPCVCVCVCAHVCARVYPRGSRRYVCTCVRAAPGAPRGPTALPSLRRGCTGTGDPAGVGGRGGSSVRAAAGRDRGGGWDRGRGSAARCGEGTGGAEGTAGPGRGGGWTARIGEGSPGGVTGSRGGEGGGNNPAGERGMKPGSGGGSQGLGRFGPMGPGREQPGSGTRVLGVRGFGREQLALEAGFVGEGWGCIPAGAGGAGDAARSAAHLSARRAAAPWRPRGRRSCGARAKRRRRTGAARGGSARLRARGWRWRWAAR